MKLVKSMTGAAAASLVAAAPAAAEGRWMAEPYVAGRISVEIADANQFIYDKGVGGVASGGIKFRKNWRAEYAFSRRTTNISGIPPLPAEGAHSTW